MLVLQIVVTTSTLGCYFYGSGTNSSRLGCDDSAVDNAAHGGNYYIADTTKCWGAEINAAFNQNVFPTLNGALCGCHSANGWHYAESVNGDAACFRTRDNINQNAQYNGPEIKCGTGYFNSGFLYYSSAEDCKAGVAKLNAIIVPLATPPPPPPPPPPTEVARIGCDCKNGNCYPADITKPFNCGSLCEDHECWVGAMNEAFNDGEKLMFHCSGMGWHYAHYEANCETTRDNINQHDQYEGGPDIKCLSTSKYDHYLYYSSAEDCEAGVAKLNAIMTPEDTTTAAPTDACSVPCAGPGRRGRRPSKQHVLP